MGKVQSVQPKGVNSKMSPEEQTKVFLYNMGYTGKPSKSVGKRAAGMFFVLVVVMCVVLTFVATPFVAFEIPLWGFVAFKFLVPSRREKRRFSEKQNIYREAYESENLSHETAQIRSRSVVETGDSDSGNLKRKYFLELDNYRRQEVNERVYNYSQVGDKIHFVCSDAMKFEPSVFLESMKAPGEYIALEFGKLFDRPRKPVESRKNQPSSRTMADKAQTESNKAEVVKVADIKEARFAANAATDITNGVETVNALPNAAPQKPPIKGTIVLSEDYIRQEMQLKAEQKLKEAFTDTMTCFVPITVGVIASFFFIEAIIFAIIGVVLLILYIKKYIPVKSAYNEYKSSGRYICEYTQVVDKDRFNSGCRIKVESRSLVFYCMVDDGLFDRIEIGQKAVIYSIDAYTAFSLVYILDEEGLGIQVPIQE